MVRQVTVKGFQMTSLFTFNIPGMQFGYLFQVFPLRELSHECHLEVTYFRSLLICLPNHGFSH